MFWPIALAAILGVLAILVLPSIRIIGPTEVGLVTKRFGLKKLPDDNPIAFHGEAGYQADLLMPGWHFKFWLVFAVEKHPWVQVRAGEIGVVVAQVGKAAAGRGEVGPIDQRIEPHHRPACLARRRGPKGRAASRAASRQPYAGASGRLFWSSPANASTAFPWPSNSSVCRRWASSTTRSSAWKISSCESP